MAGPFVHNIDPIIFSIAGVNAWWYGLSFTLGFLNAHLFLRRVRERLGLSLSQVYDLTLFLSIGVLLGGRSLIVFSNEWTFYREHLDMIPAIWLGGFATHGLILGGTIGVLIFCLVERIPFRPVFDVLAISAAIILAFGRVGNFIDGQIYGSLTEVSWAVKFPNVDGFRHPVVLYDGLKNFLLVPLLLLIRSLDPPPGRIAAVFLVTYAGLRIPIDLFREYPITTLGLPTGQTLNLVMLAAGIVALSINIFRGRTSEKQSALAPPNSKILWPRKLLLAIVLVVPLVIPSDATRDVPYTYTNRHPGLEHNAIYPPLQDELMRTAETSRGR